MDTDEAPISGPLKTWLFWGLGVFGTLLGATLGLVLYALFTRSFSPQLAIEIGSPLAIGVAVVVYVIAVFHRKLQSVSRFRLVAISIAVFALAAAVTWALMAFVVAHPSRKLELVLRLFLLCVFIMLGRVVWKQRRK